uniref:Major facilitator superfamily (MFS) profile domain-containing protein n=1 Tax=Leersia perrieri TaxID=77586 RepID=A0A0D9UZF4_9ORYZ
MVLNDSVVVEECVSGPTAEENSGGCPSLFTNWPLMSAITDVAYAEVFSLWAVSNRNYGGLGFSSQDVGSVLAFSGFLLLILTIPLLSSYPFMAGLSGFVLQLVVNCASFLKNAITVTTITVFNILMNDAVAQDLRGSANGLAVTMMSIFKSIAPAVAGAIFSWAQRRRKASFLPGDHLVFFFLNIFTVIGLVSTFRPFYARSSTKQ